MKVLLPSVPWPRRYTGNLIVLSVGCDAKTYTCVWTHHRSREVRAFLVESRASRSIERRSTTTAGTNDDTHGLPIVRANPYSSWLSYIPTQHDKKLDYS